MAYKPSENHFYKKWSENIQLIGFTAVPNALLLCYKDLNITTTELIVIIAIDSFRFTVEDPWPSLNALSQRCGYSPRTISRAVSSLVEKGHIARTRRPNTSNKYSLEPLVTTLDTLIVSFIQRQHDNPEDDNPSGPHKTNLTSKEYPTNNTNLRRKAKNIALPARYYDRTRKRWINLI